jgi:hypothetical protein
MNPTKTAPLPASDRPADRNPHQRRHHKSARGRSDEPMPDISCAHIVSHSAQASFPNTGPAD